MDRTIFCVTNSKNNYIYDNQLLLCSLVHPELRRVHENQSVIDDYYLKKYLYLKQYGFFGDKNAVNLTNLTDRELEKNLSGVSKIVFEVTDACNLSCRYCGYGNLYEVYGERNNNCLDFNSAKILLDFILNLKTKEYDKDLIIGFYGGEPLLNFDFILKVVNYVESMSIDNGLNVKYSMTTNATLLIKHIDFLIKYNFEILVSLDGNISNNEYRIFKSGKPTFSDLVNDLDLIQDKYAEFFSKNISFNAVLHDKNSVKDIYDFFFPRYNKLPSISELVKSNVKPSMRQKFYDMFKDLRDNEDEYFHDCGHLSEAYIDSIEYNDVKNFFKYMCLSNNLWTLMNIVSGCESVLPTNTCSPFSLKIFLTCTNKLLPCERISHKYSLGEIKKGDVVIDFSEITKNYNSYFTKVSMLCGSCYLYRCCGKCIYQILNFSHLDDDDPICDKYCDISLFESKLGKLFSVIESRPNIVFDLFNELD